MTSFLYGFFSSHLPLLGIIALISFHQPPEGDSRPRNPPLKIPLMRL
jgi:hypothetical protein